jgi:flagella basal body P-ring formation protein FlgA
VKRLCAILLLAGSSAASAASQLALELRGAVLLEHPRLTLGEVVLLPAGADAALAGLELGAAPRVGYVERLSREQIALLLARRAGIEPASIDWSGAASVALRTRSQAVAPEELAAAATQAVRAAFGGRFPDLAPTPAAAPATLELPLGEYRIMPRAPDSSRLAERIPVWLDVWIGGAVYRSVVVPVALRVPRQVYVARRDMAAGALAGPEDFEAREQNLAALAAMPAPAPGAPWRLRQRMRAGQVLDERQLARPGLVFRGDAVRVVVRAGAIAIEAQAVALADAAPGERLAVRAAASREAITGRVDPSGVIVMDGARSVNGP